MEKQEKNLITRRDVIKAGGLLAVGLAYSKPLVETVMAKPAFNGYDPGSTPTPGSGGGGGNCHGDCPDGYTGPAWDCSSISVTAHCEGGIAVFTITNVGSGNMGGSLPYTIYEMVGGTQGPSLGGGSFGPLGSGASQDVPVDHCGKIRLVANQHPCHPGGSEPRADTTCRAC